MSLYVYAAKKIYEKIIRHITFEMQHSELAAKINFTYSLLVRTAFILPPMRVFAKLECSKKYDCKGFFCLYSRIFLFMAIITYYKSSHKKAKLPR